MGEGGRRARGRPAAAGVAAVARGDPRRRGGPRRAGRPARAASAGAPGGGGGRLYRATVRRGVDVGRQLAWTRGVLAFDGTPLGEVVRTLERWYNVEIRLDDSALAARRLTATFQNESIDLVLQRIALTVGLRVERADGSVILLRNGREPACSHTAVRCFPSSSR